MMKIKPIHPRFLSKFLFTSLLFTVSVKAQSGSEDIGAFDFLGQLNKAVTYENNLDVGPVACVPTAVANGLYYLQHYAAMQGQPDPFTVSPGDYTAVNQLAQAMGTSYMVFINPNPPPPKVNSGGTDIAPSALGLMTYLSAKGQNPAPTVSVKGQYSPDCPLSWIGTGFGEKGFTQNFSKTTPTAAYIAAALNANDAVEIGVQFGNFGGNSALQFNPNGGHEMTVYDIDFNAKTEKGTIDFIDPFGTSAYTAQGALTLNDGTLYLQYTTQNGDKVFGRILDDVVESVPDHALTCYMLGGSLLVLGAYCRFGANPL